MDWRAHIHTDPGIRFGRPVFRDTRITVEMVLKLMAAGWTAEQMAEEYPGILPIHLRIAAAFAAELIGEDTWVINDPAKAA